MIILKSYIQSLLSLVDYIFFYLEFCIDIVIIANYYSSEAGKRNFQCYTLYAVDPANGVQHLDINE